MAKSTKTKFRTGISTLANVLDSIRSGFSKLASRDASDNGKREFAVFTVKEVSPTLSYVVKVKRMISKLETEKDNLAVTERCMYQAVVSAKDVCEDKFIDVTVFDDSDRSVFWAVPVKGKIGATVESIRAACPNEAQADSILLALSEPVVTVEKLKKLKETHPWLFPGTNYEDMFIPNGREGFRYEFLCQLAEDEEYDPCVNYRARKE